MAFRALQPNTQGSFRPINQEPAQPEKSFLRKAGDLFTASTQKFGTTAGQAFAAESVTKALSEADQINSQVRLDLTKKIVANRNAGKDTLRLEQALAQLPTSNIQQDVANIVPAINKTTGQVLGEALGTAVEATSGGAISGFKGFGLGKTIAPTATEEALKRSQFLAKPLTGRLAEIGVNTAKNLATTVPFGYASDVSTSLQEGKTGMEIAKPGIGTLITSVIPIGIGGVQATRQIAADTLGKVVAPNLSGVPSGAYERLKTGKPQEFLGKVTPRSVLDDARASASAFNSTMKRQFGSGKEEIIQEFTGKRVGLNEQIGNKLIKIAERFGFDDRLPGNLQDLSPKETMDILAEINAIKPVTAVDDPLVRSLKLNLADIKKELMDKAVKEFGGEGGKFQQIYDTYTKKSNVLKNIQSIIGKVGIKPNSVKLTPVQEKTAIGRLQRVFTENADGYIEAIKALEDETGQKILDKVAASQLSPVAPKSLKGGVPGIPGLDTGVLGFLSDVISLVTFPISSPRIGQWLIRKIGGYDATIATKLLNASPSVRTAIYNAVNKENMSFDDAVRLYARDYIKNPQLGLAIQDVTKDISPIYKGEKDLTTKVLKTLEGKTTVSKQFLLDATNRPELKQVERDLIRQALQGEGDKINVADFAKKVKAELLPLKMNSSKNGELFYPKYENITLPDEIKGNVKNYEERIYESPIKTSAGQTHFEDVENYFGHTRIEDMADNKTRRVIEVQSDLYQKGNLENMVQPSQQEIDAVNSYYGLKGKDKYTLDKLPPKSDLRDIAKYGLEGGSTEQSALKAGNKNLQKLQQYNDPTAHFRMIREEIKKAAQDGKTKLQFPTGETAMKIEGLGGNQGQNRWWDVSSDPTGRNATQIMPNDLEVGKDVYNGMEHWIITDVLGDGKFKAVPKREMTRGQIEMKEFPNYLKEEFDISGKVDTNNPIYKFYEKDVQKYLQKFGGKRIIDDKGVSWIEVPITKEQGKMPVEAFGLVGALGLGAYSQNK